MRENLILGGKVLGVLAGIVAIGFAVRHRSVLKQKFNQTLVALNEAEEASLASCLENAWTANRGPEV